MKKLFKILKLVSTTAIFIGVLITPTFAVLAQPNQNPYVPLAPIPGTTESCSGINCGTQLPTYLTGMFKVGIVLSGVLAFLMIVLGGFQYLSTDALTGKEEGRERIERAIGGLVLALTSYIILYSINPALVNLDLNFGKQAIPKNGLLAPSDMESLDKLYATLRKEVADTVKTADEKKAAAAQIRSQMDEVTDEAALQTMKEAADKLEYDALILEERKAISQNKILAMDGAVNRLDLTSKQDAFGYQTLMIGAYKNAITDAKRFNDIESVKKLELEKFASLNETATAITFTDINKGNSNIAKKTMEQINNEAVAAASRAEIEYQDPALAQSIRNSASATIEKIKEACGDTTGQTTGKTHILLSCRNWPN